MTGAPKPATPFTSLEELTIAPVIGVSSPQAFASRVGLRTGDRILMLDNTEVNSWSEVFAVLNTLQKSKISEADIEVQRGLEKARFRFRIIFSEEEPFAGIIPSELFIKEVFPSSLAAKAGLQEGGQIKAINGVAVSTLTEARKALSEATGPNTEFLVIHDGQEFPLSLNCATAGEKIFGVRSMLLLNPIARIQPRELNLLKALGENFGVALHWSGWGVQKLAVLGDLPKLNVSNRSFEWFMRDPHDWATAQESFSFYLTVVAIFCASSIPFVILAIPFVARSSRPKAAIGAQYAVCFAVLGLLWILVATSIDRFFIL